MRSWGDMGAIKGRYHHRTEEVFFHSWKPADKIAPSGAQGMKGRCRIEAYIVQWRQRFHQEPSLPRPPRKTRGEGSSTARQRQTDGLLLAAGVFLLLFLPLILGCVRHTPVPAFRLPGVVGGKTFDESPFRRFHAAILEPFQPARDGLFRCRSRAGQSWFFTWRHEPDVIGIRPR